MVKAKGSYGFDAWIVGIHIFCSGITTACITAYLKQPLSGYSGFSELTLCKCYDENSETSLLSIIPLQASNYSKYEKT